jgi:hypothetical protein
MLLDIEEHCIAIHKAHAGKGKWLQRRAVAMNFGYMDAKYSVHLFETSGLPIEFIAEKAAEQGQKLDYMGLKYELLGIGMNPRTVGLQIERARDAWRVAAKEKVCQKSL